MAQGRQAAELGQVNRGTGNIAKLRPLVSSGGIVCSATIRTVPHVSRYGWLSSSAPKSRWTFIWPDNPSGDAGVAHLGVRRVCAEP
jgi:hypothetical protein